MQPEDKLDAGRRIFADAIRELRTQIDVITDQKIQAAIAPLNEKIAALEGEIKALKDSKDTQS